MIQDRKSGKTLKKKTMELRWGKFNTYQSRKFWLTSIRVGTCRIGAHLSSSSPNHSNWKLGISSLFKHLAGRITTPLKLRRLSRPRNKEADMELRRSNSLQLSRRDPSINFMDDTNIQIIISSVEATPAAASLHNENRLINGLTLEEYKRIRRGLEVYARRDKWYLAELYYDEFPDLVRIPLTASGDTALHVAVSANSSTFVQNLVNLMTPEDLEIPNADKNTAFCMAAITGHGHFFQIMIENNQNLPLITGHDDMLPVHLAALNGHHNIVQDLSSQNLLEKMALKDIKRLFLMTIGSSMYDVATKLFEKYPADLAIAKDDEEDLTALHMLARKHSEKNYMQQDNNKEASSGRGDELQLLKRLWSQVGYLGSSKFLELTTEPSAVLFDAVKSGNVEVVKWILYMNRELLTIKDPNNGRNLLHYAVFYRQRNIVNWILKMETVNLIIRAEDKDRNNVLHLAVYQPMDAYPSLIWDNERELMWFKEVERSVPHELKKMRNSHNKTPEDIFLAKYEKISQEVKGSAKTIAKSGMVVATLLVNVAFAAALIVPGDKNSAGFIVFILSNAVALFTSSASIVSFMSTFGSRFTKNEFIILLHPCVILGRSLLFISIASMFIAFAAASFLIFDHTSKWVAYVVASMGLLPTLLMFLVLQIPPFDGLIDYFFKSTYYDRSKKVQ